MPGKGDPNREEFQIGTMNNGEGGNIRFYHSFPYLDTSDSTRTKELKPIGRPTIVQSFGRKATRVTIEGNALEGDEIQYIRSLKEVEGSLDLVHEDWQSGNSVILTDLMTRRARGSHEITLPNREDPHKVYYYKIEAVEEIQIEPEDSLENLLEEGFNQNQPINPADGATGPGPGGF